MLNLSESKQKILDELVAKEKDFLLQLRRELHLKPELSGKEYQTSKFIKEQLKKWQIPYQEIAPTSILGVIDSQKPGQNVALRADIDALPLTEKADVAFKSENEGVMHACGHDAHMAMQLVVAKILAEHKDLFTGKIYLIFESGEEDASGIDYVIKALKAEPIDYIYGTHVASFQEIGEASCLSEAVMAGQYILRLTIKGKSGHGARPDLAQSPIVATGMILQALQAGWMHILDLRKPVTFSFGTVHGGFAHNVIPDEVVLTGTMRFFDEEAGKVALELWQKLVLETATLYGTKAEIEIVKFIPPVKNDVSLADLVRELQTDLGLKQAQEAKWNASETFAKYQEIAPSVFTFLGCANQSKGMIYGHHHEQFMVDEDCLTDGVKLALRTTLSLLQA